MFGLRDVVPNQRNMNIVSKEFGWVGEGSQMQRVHANPGVH